MSDKQRIITALQSVVPNVITDRCCSTCSTSGIPDGPYAYFHAQDIERALSLDGDKPVADEPTVGYGYSDEDDYENDGLTDSEMADAIQRADILVAPLYIGYGTDTGSARTVTPVRKAIVKALKEANFMVTDPGNNGSRISIEGIDGVKFADA
jgi:hypothetical protein